MKWLLLDGDGRAVGSTVATGRTKALHVARRAHGGHVHMSGTRTPALLGSSLARVVTAHEAVERDGELMLRDEATGGEKHDDCR